MGIPCLKVLTRYLTRAEADLVFSGTSASECETFIYRVRKAAFAEGRHKDSKWMAELASSCLREGALSWHADLDPEVQHDWKLLQQALIRQYVMNSRDPVIIDYHSWRLAHSLASGGQHPADAGDYADRSSSSSSTRLAKHYQGDSHWQ